MTIAVDVCVGRVGVRHLRDLGHVVIEAEHGESDRSWFARALEHGVDLVVSADVDIEILAYDHNVRFYRPVRGHCGLLIAQIACSLSR